MSEKVLLYKTRKISTTVRERFSEDEFVGAIKRDKPDAIYCSEWSNDKPLYVITKYQKYGVKYYCNAMAKEDQKPTWVPYKGFYKIVRNAMSYAYYRPTEAHI